MGITRLHLLKMVHTDLTPCNVQLKGAGTGDCAIDFAVVGDDRQFAGKYFEKAASLQHALLVCIADCSSCVPGDVRRISRQQAPLSEHVMPNAAMTWPYRAPEVCLGDSANYLVDLWAYGCTLEELAHKDIGFRGRLEFCVIERILRRFGTPSKPQP